MAEYYSNAFLKHTLAHIAPPARPIYIQVEFEVFGNIHGKLSIIEPSYHSAK